MNAILPASILILGSASLLVAQGGLDPSSPPTPGMKHLAQLNPGTPLAGPATLSSPGRYYLTSNLTGQVTITSSNVTLDLNGFLLQPEDGGIGILAEGPGQSVLRNVTVQNGSIAGGQTAIKFVNVCNGTLSDLSIKDNTLFDPVVLLATERSDSNRIERCAFFRCGGGVKLFVEAGATGRGNLIHSCVFSECLPCSPISIGTTGGTCSGNQVRDCAFWLSPQHVSIRALLEGARCEGNRVERCAAARTEGIIILGVSEGQSLKGNVVAGCTLASTSFNSVGISIRGQQPNEVTGNRVEGCVITGISQGVSIRNADGNLLKNSLIHDIFPEGGTAPWSIAVRDSASGNRIVGNHLADGVPGISLDQSFTTILTGNSIVDHASAFDITSSTYTRGPTVSTSGTLGNSGAAAHPWANFVR